MVKKPTHEEVGHMVKELEEAQARRRRASAEASYERNLFQTLLSTVPEYVYFDDREEGH